MPKQYEQTFYMNFKANADDTIQALKNIQQQMQGLNANPRIFDNVKKEFQKMDQLNSNLKAALASGIKQPNDFTKLNKLINDLELSMNQAKTELNQIKNNANGAFQFKNVADAEEKLNKLNTKLKETQSTLKKSQKDLASDLKGLGFSDSEAKTIVQSTKTQQEFNQRLQDEITLRKQNLELAQQQANADKVTKASALLGTKNTRIITEGNIQDKGTFGSKVRATSTANNIISVGFVEGIKNGKTLQQIIDSITEKISETGIVLDSNDKIVNKITEMFSQLNAETVDLNNQVAEAQIALNSIATTNETGDLIPTVNVENLVNGFETIEQGINSVAELEQNVEQVEEAIDAIDNDDVLDQFTSSIDEADSGIQNFASETQQAVQSTQQEVQQANELTETFNRLTSTIKNILSLTNAWRQLNKIIRQTFTDVQSLDKAFASIAMVTNKTIGELWDSYDAYADIANRLGQSTESAIQASALFYQQGLDTADALSLTEDTMKLATLAGEDFATATQQITAALRGFKMEMDEGSHVTDVYSELAASAAADVQGIAYAMSKTASIGA